MENDGSPHKFFELTFILSELVIIVAYVLVAEFNEDAHHPSTTSVTSADKNDLMQTYYTMWQHVHVMVFVGFGFLMVFLKTHCWTSVGFNFLIAAYAMQITILITSFWHDALILGSFRYVPLDIPALVVGDFGAAAVLISFGALLGKCSILQLWILATIEVIFYGLNEAVGAGILGAVDVGGSMYIHTFGAYFGLAASFFFKPKKAISDVEKRCSGGYNS